MKNVKMLLVLLMLSLVSGCQSINYFPPDAGSGIVLDDPYYPLVFLEIEFGETN